MSMLSRVCLWVLVGAAGIGACSSEDKVPSLGGGATAGSAGSGGRGGKSSDEPGGAESVEAGAPTAVGGNADEPPVGEIGGEGVYVGEGGAPSLPATQCAEDVSFEPTPVAGIDTAGDERLLAMTHDEKTLVFARGDSLFVLDSGAPTELALPAGYSHAAGVAVSPDGLALVIVATDRKRFAEVSRAQRTGAFSTSASSARFAAINDAVVFSGDTLSSPALSADGLSLYYTAHKGSTSSYVWRAHGAAFEDAVRLYTGSLGAEDGKAKRVVSVSADERTLFVFDEALGYVTGFWSTRKTADFIVAVPFEGFESIFTSQGCARIYGTTEVSGSLAVVAGAAK
jgi:hypothetical protein